MLRNPATLFSKNIVGPPSVILHRNSGHLKYDKSIKWVIDIDFYIRYFKTTVPVYIDEPLINVGLGSHQVTMDCVNQRKVEIPENFYLLNKLGVTELKNIMIYDAFWRLMRNLEIEKLSDITDSGYIGDIPHAIRNIVKVQSRLPKWMYKKGLASKISMALSYIFNFNK